KFSSALSIATMVFCKTLWSAMTFARLARSSERASLRNVATLDMSHRPNTRGVREARREGAERGDSLTILRHFGLVPQRRHRAIVVTTILETEHPAGIITEVVADDPGVRHLPIRRVRRQFESVSAAA